MTDELPPAPIGHNIQLDPHSFGNQERELAEMCKWATEHLAGDVRYSYSRVIRDLRSHEIKKYIGLTIHLAEEADYHLFRERYGT